MRRAIRLLGWWGCLGLMLSWVVQPAQGQASVPLYAYAFQTKGDEISIMVINPSNVSSVSVLMTTPAPQEFALRSAEASPDGKFIALVISSPESQIIRLVDVSSHQTRDIAQITLPVIAHEMMNVKHLVFWSPDSHYLAFPDMPQPDDPSLHIYSLDEDRLTTVAEGSGQYQVVWSNDSTRLAMVVRDCEIDCRLELKTIDTTGQDLHDLVNLNRFLGSVPSVADNWAVCNLDWSPGGLYLSFMMGCDATEPGGSKEMYVFDVTQNQIRKLTSFVDLSTPSGELFSTAFANYAPFWYDAQTLLMGVVYSNNTGDSVKTQTMIYQFPQATFTLLSPSMFQEWARNPVSGEIALRSERYDPTTIFKLTDSSVQIRSTGGENPTIVTLPSTGCDLSWSPDGKTLAYGERPSALDFCHSAISRLQLVDQNSGQASGYKLPPNAVLAGWVWAALTP